jgi:hypothetical protein
VAGPELPNDAKRQVAPLGTKPEEILDGGAVSFGGTLAAIPRPIEKFFPLRRDQFLTFCDGEMSEARLVRDACMGAFATGLVGMAGILLTIDWNVAARQGRHPLLVTLILSTLTLAALVVGLVEHRRMKQMRTKSSYSRLIQTIASYFGISVPS